jgi:uncharacterized SAM-binding protein YcdF (DUF218 family)
VFYFVSKGLAWATAPAAWCPLLLAAAFLLRRRLAVAVALAVLATSVPFVFSSPVVAEALQQWTEASARNTSRRDVQYDAVIVLGGDVEGGPRFRGGADAIRSGRARRLLYSGLLRPGEPERLRASLRALGVPDDRIVIEGRSRNTRENAVESSRVVAERGWRSVLLVTSAAHVDRALGCFHKLGMRPDVLPVGYLSPSPRGAGWRPRSGALGLSTAAMHELMGRPVYWAMGYAD